jgi:hypothetical protein
MALGAAGRQRPDRIEAIEPEWPSFHRHKRRRRGSEA